MKKDYRVLEGNMLVLGKGIWIKLLCHYGTWFYIFSFSISNVFHVSLIKHNTLVSILPRYEFNLSLFGKKVFDTAKEAHQKISDSLETTMQERATRAAKAKKELAEKDMLDIAKDYASGGFYLKS